MQLFLCLFPHSAENVIRIGNGCIIFGNPLIVSGNHREACRNPVPITEMAPHDVENYKVIPLLRNLIHHIKKLSIVTGWRRDFHYMVSRLHNISRQVIIIFLISTPPGLIASCLRHINERHQIFR